MGDGGFYVTLPCNASLDVYTNNTISNYRTMLGNPINLRGKWEVGIVEIEYPRTWYTFSTEDAFFDIITEVGESNIYNDSKRLFIKAGYYENVTSVISEINKALKPNGVMGYDNIRNRVFLKAPAGVLLMFSGKLAVILGLKPNVPIGMAMRSPDP